MAPTYVLAYNTGDSPVVVDNVGHTIAGHEWAAVRRGDTLDAAGNRNAVVVLTTIDEESAGDEAKAAYHQAQEWTAAAEKWAPHDLDTIRDVGRRQLLGADAPTGDPFVDATPLDGLERADLVDMLVRANIPIPAAKPAKRASSPQE